MERHPDEFEVTKKAYGDTEIFGRQSEDQEGMLDASPQPKSDSRGNRTEPKMITIPSFLLVPLRRASGDLRCLVARRKKTEEER
jgi:hypothetical protein